MILKTILNYKRREIAGTKKRIPLTTLIRKVAEQGILKKRPFRAALSAKGGTRLICELKQASPSGGLLRKIPNPVRIAHQFEKAGACAISVLTERHFFKGSPEFLSRVRSETKLPVLRKDFLIEPYQVYETALMGADAMLLIASLLSRHEIRKLLKLARRFKLEVLVEIHTREELKKALGAGARVIGINNRDLKTLKTNLSISEQIIPFVPKGVALVIESGVRNRKDVVRYQRLGVNAFLVGTALMKAKNIGQKIRELRGV